MIYIIVGSVALSKFGLNRREPIDTDIWIDESLGKLPDIQPEVGNFDTVTMPDKIVNLVPTIDGIYATPDAIYTIKCSHAIYDIKWQKTKLDILHLKWNGCKIIPELYEALKLHWKKVHGNKDFLSLNKTKEDFFTDNVVYTYDHDMLHELVAYPNKPMYSNCLKDGEEVLIDKEKFDAMPFEDQIRMFREEITVIAAERWLIPKRWRGTISWYQAYKLSLQKTVVSLTKGYYSYFLVENLEHFIKPDYSYFKHLLETLEEISMSKVDLKVFEDLIADGGNKGEHSLEWVIFCLCSNEFNEAIGKTKKSEWGYKHLDQDGGGEGGAEDCYGVFELKGVAYKAEYSYYSYAGYDVDDILDTLRIVTPIEKTITVWE